MYKFLLLFLLFPISLFSQIKQDSINQVVIKDINQLKEQNVEIEFLKKEFAGLTSRYEYELKMSEKAFDRISEQISAASYSLNIFGIAFAIFAILLGVYIANIEKRVEKIRDDTQKLLDATNTSKSEVENINNLIQRDIKGLFLKIKREETVFILERLVNVPRDISNLIHQLLSRELESGDFLLIKKAYISLKENYDHKILNGIVANNPLDTYMLLFFQHFLDQAIKDDVICPDMKDFLPVGILSSFENDILKSSADFTGAIVDEGIHNKVEEINSFMKGLSNCQYKDAKDVYKTIFDNLKTRENQFKFFDIIPDKNESNLSKYKFGEILIEQYEKEDPSESEVLSMTNCIEIRKKCFELAANAAAANATK